jgi:hypothetical protein
MTASPTPVQGSIRSRFDAALQAVRADGMTVAVNVMTCCRSCTTYADMGLAEEADGLPVAWHFGGQGHELAWDDDDHPVYLEEERGCYCEVLAEDDDECDVCHYGEALRCSRAADKVVFSFEPDESVGCRVRDAFVQGFGADWNGSLAQAVTVRLA